MIKLAICDDEPSMLEDMYKRLTAYMAEKKLACQIRCFTCGSEVLASEDAMDVLFLDIRMAELDGLETAKRLRERGYTGLLIFTTVLREEVYEAFEVEAFDYWLKPLEDSRFRRTMERVVHSLIERKNDRIVIQKGETYQVILLTQITYCEVLGRKLYLHRQDGETVDYYDKLEELEKRVDGRFFRCHRSYLINLEHIRGYEGGMAILDDGSKVPVSRLRKQELTQALLLYMKGRRC